MEIALQIFARVKNTFNTKKKTFFISPKTRLLIAINISNKNKTAGIANDILSCYPTNQDTLLVAGVSVTYYVTKTNIIQ